MNFNLYIHGEPSGYDMYPEDSNDELYQRIYSEQKTAAQLTIFRKQDLVYCVYSHVIKDNLHFGFIVVFNGICFKTIKGAYDVCERVYSDIVLNGKYVKIEKSGEVVFTHEHFAYEPEEYDRIKTILNREFEEKKRTLFVDLPKIFHVGQSDKTCSFEDESSLVATIISHYDRLVVPNDTSGQVDYVSDMLSALYKENSELKEQNTKINSQKKQYKLVLFLSLLMIGCGVGIYFLNNNILGLESQIKNLNNRINFYRRQIVQKNDSLSIQASLIKSKNIRISSLDSDLAAMKNKKEQLEQSLSEIKSYYPIVITDIQVGNTYSNGNFETPYGGRIYSSYSMYLKPKITYIGLDAGEIKTLYVKLYTPSGSMSTGNSSPKGYSFSSDIYISSGTGNTWELSGWGNSTKGNWPKGSYRFEVWYGGICLKTKSFSVY